MRSSSAASLSTARRVEAQRSTSPFAAACGRNSAATRAKSGRERDAGALGRERAGLQPRQVEQLRELRLERVDGVLDVADQRPPRASRARAASAAV